MLSIYPVYLQLIRDLRPTREALAGLELGEARRFIDGIDSAMRAKFDHIIGTLVRNVF